MECLPFFIGYDSRETAAFEVCRRSLLRHSSIPLHVQSLDIRALEHAGLFSRPWSYEDGQFIDLGDGKPFSTEFSFTRFLVPALCQWKGWAAFSDSDFLWRADIAELVEQVDDAYAVMVVQHDHEPDETVKMRGQAQSKVYRKNWSSLVLWNCEHPANRVLTPARVSRERGQWLHAFSWLHTEEIGRLPEAWNWLAGHSSDTIDPKAVHHTLGTPDMPGMENAPYADEWREAAEKRPEFATPEEMDAGAAALMAE